MIVGAGLSGLAAGLALVRRGHRVRLLEANAQAGGCCSTEDVDGYRFNNGAMYVAVPRLLDHAFERLGLDRARVLPLRPIRVPQASVFESGTLIRFGSEGDSVVEGRDGASRTAVLRAELECCVRKWVPVLRTFADDLMPHPPSAARLLAKAWRHLPKLAGTLSTEIRRNFTDPEVRAAVSAVTLYTGLAPERTPIFQIMGLAAMLDEGFFLPEGGMGAITRVLEHAFVAAGGELSLSTPVRALRAQAGRIGSVVLEDGRQLLGDAVLSTASAMTTFECLLAAGSVPARIRRKLRKLPLSHRALGIQLGLRNRILPAAYATNHVPSMEQQHRLLVPQPSGVRWFSFTTPTIDLPELAPDGGSVVEMFAAVDPAHPLDEWNDRLAREQAHSAIDALSRHHALDIATCRIVTPRDYERRMHLFDGALYGLSPGASPTAQFAHETPVPGLFQAGQTTHPGYGVGPAMWSGILAAEAMARFVEKP